MAQFASTVNFDVVPEIRDAVQIADDIYGRFNLEVYVTSANDGVHRTEAHSLGGAVDLRSKGLPSNIKQSILSRLKSSLGSAYTVLFENPGGIQEHFHIQYNPTVRVAVPKGIFSQFLPGEPGIEVPSFPPLEPRTSKRRTYPIGPIQFEEFEIPLYIPVLVLGGLILLLVLRR